MTKAMLRWTFGEKNSVPPCWQPRRARRNRRRVSLQLGSREAVGLEGREAAEVAVADAAVEGEEDSESDAESTAVSSGALISYRKAF